MLRKFMLSSHETCAASAIGILIFIWALALRMCIAPCVLLRVRKAAGLSCPNAEAGYTLREVAGARYTLAEAKAAGY